MINIAELLRNAPKGIKLYSPLFGEVEYMQLGDNDKIWIKVDNSEPFDKYGRYFGSHFKDAECLLFPSKNCRTWEGWVAPTKPKFKIGDWLVYKDGGRFCQNSKRVQIQTIENSQYIFTQGTSGSCHFIDNECRLWTIEDAQDGDIIHTPNNNLFIYKCKGTGVQIYDHCGLYHGKFEPDSSSPNGVFNPCDGYIPANKEQCELLFTKMKEAGYQWDADKKELYKIIKPKFNVGDKVLNDMMIVTVREVVYDQNYKDYKYDIGNYWVVESVLKPYEPHYDISNFYAGMPVLVRDANDKEWRYVLYSHYTERLGSMHFNAGATVWNQCIPFNEETKHLLGTTNMCSKEYINW